MRRHDLDWLRVLVFALLIIYHVGMFYVPWGWHIKNNTTYDWLIYPMIFVNQWRLPILFMISGMGTFYALNKRDGQQFIGERIRRLLLPLVVGMLIIVPPQVYIERVADATFSGSYWEFWPQLAFQGVYPEGNLSWHHLWFLPYLLVFSIALAPVFLRLKKNPGLRWTRWLNKKVASPTGIFLFIIPLYFTEALIEPFFPVTHALIDDWFAIVNYGILFFYGFALMTVQDSFWTTVIKHRRKFLLCGILGFTAYLFLILSFEDTIYLHFTEAIFKVFNLWAWILICFGYAAKYLNKPSRSLTYANEAVYPFYILHQTVTIILAYYLGQQELGFAISFTILLVGTFLGSWLIYAILIWPWRWIRPFFGLKLQKARYKPDIQPA